MTTYKIKQIIPAMTDHDYIKTMLPSATEIQIEQFCERVAICMADGITENRARLIAVAGIYQ